MNSIPPLVKDLVEYHAETWRDKPESYWFCRLVEEIGELGSTLVGHPHRHGDDTVDLELAEIASICINWLKMREERT